ncbi:MAG: hypothetical protein IJA42_01865 [Bacteroidales bacterium]|nr:hypothetical protein [Bacteroidales bacterium]
MKKNNNIGIQEMVQRSNFSVHSMKMLFVLLFVSIGLNSYSQTSPVFAGEDKYVFFDPDSRVGEVKLGKTDDSNDVYYVWDTWDQPAGGNCEFDNYYISNPTVTFYEPGRYVFQCIKVSKFGHKKEYVVLNVTSKVDILDVEPKSSMCFIHGSALSKLDFNITTQPSGCEEYVEIKEGTDVLNGKMNTIWPFYMHKVKFQALDEDGEYYDSKITCEIPVINDQKRIDRSDFSLASEIPAKVEEHVDNIANTIGCVNRLHCLSDPATILPPSLYNLVYHVSDGGNSTVNSFTFIKTFVDAIGVLPASIGFKYNSKFNGVGLNFLCDNGNIYPEIYFNGKLEAELSVSMDAPLGNFYGVRIDASGTYGQKFIVGDGEEHILDTRSSSLKIPAKQDPYLYLGLTLSFLSPSIISGTAGFQLEFHGNTYVNVNKLMKSDTVLCPDCKDILETGIETDGFDIHLYLKLATTVMSLQTSEYKYLLF